MWAFIIIIIIMLFMFRQTHEMESLDWALFDFVAVHCILFVTKHSR